MIIAVLAGFYISKGGWERSVFTDIIQTISVSVFIILLAYMLISKDGSAFVLPEARELSTVSLWLFGAALFINNIGYSLVSPNNWQIAQSSGEITEKLFYVGGAILFMFSACVYLLSGYVPTGSPFYIFSHVDLLTAMLVAAIPLFVWSTIDTSSVALSNLADSMLSPHIDDSNEDGRKLHGAIRKNYPLLFLIAAVFVSHVLNTYQPNIFQSLLGATSSLIVFVPAIYAGLVTDKTNYLYSLNCSMVMFALFFTVVVVAVTLTLFRLGEYIFSVSVAGFLLGTVVVWYHNRR